MNKFIERCQAFADGKTLRRFNGREWVDQSHPDIREMRDYPDLYRVKAESVEAHVYRNSHGELFVTSAPHAKHHTNYIKTITVELDYE